MDPGPFPLVLGAHKEVKNSHRCVLASLVSHWCLCGGCDPHLLVSPSSSILCPPSLVLHWVRSPVAEGSVLDHPETQGSCGGICTWLCLKAAGIQPWLWLGRALGLGSPTGQLSLDGQPQEPQRCQRTSLGSLGTLQERGKSCPEAKPGPSSCVDRVPGQSLRPRSLVWIFSRARIPMAEAPGMLSWSC